MKNIETLMSSKKHDWGTPQDLFYKLDAVFNFNLDACANDENYKHINYITEQENALLAEWESRSTSQIKAWLNPPYGSTLGAWLDKAQIEAGAGCVVVVLIPARTETKWFNTIWKHADHVLFFNKRIVFDGATSSAPFPSALGIFNRVLTRKEKQQLEELGKIIDL